MNAAVLRLPMRPLQGRYVRLEPYAEALRDPVRAALDEDADAWSLFASSGQGEHFDRWWASSLAEMRDGTRIAYAIRELSHGEVVGSTSFLRIRPAHRSVEIGSTFLRPDARAGSANPDAKRLMLTQAFDRGAVRVELVTDLRNLRSQAAIAKLGAVREGVLRRERITWTGHVRDTVVFSITALEWPAVRARLDDRLSRFAPPGPPLG